MVDAPTMPRGRDGRRPLGRRIAARYSTMTSDTSQTVEMDVPLAESKDATVE